MINIISWNIREIGSQGSLERLKNLKTEFQIPLFRLQEPMVNNIKLSRFKRRLEMNNGISQLL